MPWHHELTARLRLQLAALALLAAGFLHPGPALAAPPGRETPYAPPPRLQLGESPASTLGRFRVDDSGTTVLQQNPTRWLSPGLPKPGEAIDALLSTARVRMVLNLSPWVGKRARIHLVLPPQLGLRDAQVSWTAQGPLRSGQLQLGEQTVVFEGAITQAQLTDVFELKVQTRASNSRRVSLEFHYEIEPLS